MFYIACLFALLVYVPGKIFADKMGGWGIGKKLSLVISHWSLVIGHW